MKFVYLTLGVLLLSTLARPVLAATGNLPRGIRNNNPGNIERTGDNWQGMAQNQSDGRYVVFTEPKYGFRAMTRILRNYQRRGLTTIRTMISTWAPETENHTENYITFVADELNVSPDTNINLERSLPTLLKAISTFENGQAYADYYSDSIIQQGIDLA